MEKKTLLVAEHIDKRFGITHAVNDVSLEIAAGEIRGLIGEFIISIIFNGFVALGAPTTIQNVVTGAALLAIVALTARGARGSVVK